MTCDSEALRHLMEHLTHLHSKEKGRGPHIRPRVRYAWIPKPWDGFWYLMLLAIGILVSWVVCFLLPILAIAWMNESVFDHKPGSWLIVTVLITGTLGAIIYVKLLTWIRYRKAARRQPFRKKRLEWMNRYSSVLCRFPHRVVEHNLINRPLSRKRIRRILRRLSPGDVVFLNCIKGLSSLGPAINDVPFEPIDLKDDQQRLVWLTILNMQNQGMQADIEDEDNGTQSSKSMRSILWNGFRIFSHYAGILFSILYVITLLIRRVYSFEFIFAAIAIGFFILALVIPLFIERRWWLVPGGMICREYRFWRKTLQVEVITPETSPMIINMRSGVGYVLNDDSIKYFPAPSWFAWPIVAGWISRARTPTDEEVRSFLNQHLHIAGT